MKIEQTINTEGDMLTLGGALAKIATPGLVIYLQGNLGAGKTTLTRGFLQALGRKGAVKSPTYTLVEAYNLASHDIYHFDLYRLSDPAELEFMGIFDYFRDDAVCLIEWPEQGEGWLPAADLSCYIEVQGTARRVILTAETVAGKQCLTKL